MFLHQFLFKQFSVRQDRCARPIWPRASPLILLEGTERRTWNERPERKLQNIKLGSKKRRFERDDLTLPLFVLILVVLILVWTFQKMCVFSHPLKDSILSSPPHFTDLWDLWLEITWNSWSIGSIKLSQNLICRYAIISNPNQQLSSKRKTPRKAQWRLLSGGSIWRWRSCHLGHLGRSRGIGCEPRAAGVEVCQVF